MANNPISMIRIRQILRLHTQGYSKLKVAAQTGISRNTLKKYLKEFSSSGLSFDEINELSDKDLEDLFVKQEDEPVNKKLQALFNRFPTVEKELKKKALSGSCYGDSTAGKSRKAIASPNLSIAMRSGKPR